MGGAAAAAVVVGAVVLGVGWLAGLPTATVWQLGLLWTVAALWISAGTHVAVGRGYLAVRRRWRTQTRVPAAAIERFDVVRGDQGDEAWGWADEGSPLWVPVAVLAGRDEPLPLWPLIDAPDRVWRHVAHLTAALRRTTTYPAAAEDIRAAGEALREADAEAQVHVQKRSRRLRSGLSGARLYVDLPAVLGCAVALSFLSAAIGVSPWFAGALGGGAAIRIVGSTVAGTYVSIDVHAVIVRGRWRLAHRIPPTAIRGIDLVCASPPDRWHWLTVGPEAWVPALVLEGQDDPLPLWPLAEGKDSDAAKRLAAQLVGELSRVGVVVTGLPRAS